MTALLNIVTGDHQVTALCTKVTLIERPVYANYYPSKRVSNNIIGMKKKRKKKEVAEEEKEEEEEDPTRRQNPNKNTLNTVKKEKQDLMPLVSCHRASHKTPTNLISDIKKEGEEEKEKRKKESGKMQLRTIHLSTWASLGSVNYWMEFVCRAALRVSSAFFDSSVYKAV